VNQSPVSRQRRHLASNVHLQFALFLIAAGSDTQTGAAARFLDDGAAMGEAIRPDS
jgi:hypothetical protein